MGVKGMPNIIDQRIVSAEIHDKLNQSRQLAQHLELRNIRCPICGFHLLDVYGYNHYLVRVKCRKCKFDEVIDTAYFRTMRNNKCKTK